MTDIVDRSPADAPLPPNRRSFLKTAGIAGAAGAVAGAAHGKFGLAPIGSAQAQPVAPPKLTSDKWWPSRWGAEDEAGASNHITPAKVLDTAKWIRDGAEVAEGTLDRLCLGHVARFKRPRHYRFVDALPKNNYGKVLKTELRRCLSDDPGR